ncbi:unnamed protein product [Prorocentrum cordatum]|uniref:Uncharacterized protein n=1 Tax=Prorocentrum cordatum TaxID=2364126 RepID=A0ABN9VNZ1_9DINO|nr:unnamed protein product [Polarella glacialis]
MARSRSRPRKRARDRSPPRRGRGSPSRSEGRQPQRRRRRRSPSGGRDGSGSDGGRDKGDLRWVCATCAGPHKTKDCPMAKMADMNPMHMMMGMMRGRPASISSVCRPFA